jgi:hypothetical protein
VYGEVRPVPPLLAALFAAMSALAPAGAEATASPPAIVFEREVCDLGSVVQGELPTCDFAFTNGGNGDLRILQVEPTCGCTTALLASPLVHAGERGTIRVVFDTESFAGEVRKEIIVRSNDPARPAITLRLTALVEAEVEFEPAALTFDGIHPGAVLRQSVALTNRRAEAIRILSISTEPSSYACSLPSWTDTSHPLELEPWDRVTLEVRFTPPPTLAMPVAGECTLEIAGPRKRRFRLKILGLPAP